MKKLGIEGEEIRRNEIRSEEMKSEGEEMKSNEKMKSKSLESSKIWQILILAIFLIGSIGIVSAEGDINIVDTGEQADVANVTDINEIAIEEANGTVVTDARTALQEPIAQEAINSITVTSPNGGENWVRGTVHTIKWTWTGTVGANIKIELLKGGVFNRLIASSTPNDGSQSWTIPLNVPLGSDYKVRITSVSFPTIKDTSNYNFIISLGYGKANFFSNKKFYTQIPLEFVRLTLQSTGTAPIWVKQTEKWKIINVATGTTRDLPICVPVGYGTCAPKKLLPGEQITKSWNQKNNAGILVSPGTYIASAKYYKQGPTTGSPTAFIAYTVFTIISTPRIVVDKPNGGELWPRGTTKKIEWHYAGSVGSYIKIELLKGGVLNRVIAASVSIGSGSVGSYNWLIPSGQTLGSDYKIRITSTTNSAYKDTSDNNFIIGGINVIYPNGGETWPRGTTKTIKWTTVGDGANVKIELLKGGVFNRLIALSTPNDGSHPYTMPSSQTLGSDYKVRITSTTNSVYKDTSNNNFIVS